MPEEIRKTLEGIRPQWPDFLHLHASANPDGEDDIKGVAFEEAQKTNGRIVGVLGVTGVPNAVFDLDSVVNWDPHSLVEVLGGVLKRIYGANFGIELSRLAWPREVHNPLTGEREHHHPLGLMLYHLAYAHDQTFHDAVLKRAEQHLRNLLTQHETGIAYGHSYGAFILKDAIAQLPDEMAQRLILVALGHAFGEIGHGWSPIGPRTSPEELREMTHRTRASLLMRVGGDLLSGIPQVENLPATCEVVRLNPRGVWEVGLGGHATVRTRPDGTRILEEFLERNLRVA